MALKPQITVSPSQTDLSGNQTIPVTFQVKDCDGSPLKNVSLTIGATQGNFDNSTITTDANGQATANYTANNVTAVGTLTAFYYPYITPTRKQKSANGSAIVYINNPNTKVWEMDITGSHSFHDHIIGMGTDYITGAPFLDYYYDRSLGSSETVRQYVEATISDSSFNVTNVDAASGDIDLTQTTKSYSKEPSYYSTYSIFTTGWPAKTEDFKYSSSLGGYTLPGSPPVNVSRHRYQGEKGLKGNHLCRRVKVAKKRFNWLLAMIGAPLLKLSAKPRKQRSPRIWYPMENYTRRAG